MCSPFLKATCPRDDRCALYWGTRKAIEAICRDSGRMQAAAEFLKDARIAARVVPGYASNECQTASAIYLMGAVD